MTSASFLNATNAYRDALRSAQNLMEKTSLPGSASAPKEVAGNSFMDMVSQALGSATAAGYKGENLAMQAMRGKADLTDVVTAVHDAETALNTVVAVRDRVINAYQDIIKMPI